MKKSIFICLAAAALLANSGFAKDSDSKIDWKDVGESGKSALKETGSFFKSLGSKVSSDVKDTVEDINEIKCTGTWYFNKKNTTIKITEDGKMEIHQKQKNDTYFWKGTCKGTLKVITFTIEEQGTESWLVSNETATKGNDKWHVSYTMQDDGTVKFFCSDIPDDIDGNSFSKGQIFTK